MTTAKLIVAMSSKKKENINRILDIQVSQGICSISIEREWMRLKEMSAVDVEIALYEIEKLKHTLAFHR